MSDTPRTALITGGARRIGKAMVEDLAANGWAIALHCNSSRTDADAIAAGIQERGGKAHVILADLTDPKAVEQLIPEAMDALGPLGLLVNNASLFEADDIETMTPESFYDHQAVNLTAPLFLSQAFVAQAHKHQFAANIINMLDQRVLKITPEFFSYQLAKSSLWVATRTMAQALAPHIRVNAISPGPTLQNARQEPEDFQAQLDGTLLKKGAQLEEFGQTIRYLVETPSITGQMICLDGGQHLAWETPDVLGVNE